MYREPQRALALADPPRVHLVQIRVAVQIGVTLSDDVKNIHICFPKSKLEERETNTLLLDTILEFMQYKGMYHLALKI